MTVFGATSAECSSQELVSKLCASDAGAAKMTYFKNRSLNVANADGVAMEETFAAPE